MSNRNKIWLFLVLLLAFALRFFALGQNPPALSWDEASIGYNAYSIFKTLKDEHGNLLPWQYFSAFGDYKPPVAIYFAVPSIALFGLSDWSIRLPSALLGVLTVLLSFLVAENLRKSLGNKNLNTHYSLLVALLLAISPWHTLISRQMFEANIATFLIVLGVYLFLLGLSKGRYLLISLPVFVLSIYTFNSPRVFVPLFLIGLFFLFKKELIKQKKYTVGAVIISVLFFIPLLPHLLSPIGQLRFKEVNIFSDSQIVLTANQRIEEDQGAFWSKILNNRRVGFARSFVKHYLDHFNIDYLFFSGDYNTKFSTRSQGQFFLIEVLFLILGVYFLASRERKIFWLLVYWLIVGLIPSATARETPHALRSEVTLPVWQFFSAAGLFFLLQQKKRIFKLISAAIFVILFSEIVFYLHDYYVHYARDYSQDWQYGYKQAALYLKNNSTKYDQIWVSEVYGRPYIFFLTYLNYNPATFQKEEKLRIDEFGFYHVDGFGNFLFGNKQNKPTSGKSLLIGREDEVGTSGKKIKEFYFLNGEKALELREL